MREQDKKMLENLRSEVEKAGAFFHIQSQILMGWETAKIREMSKEIVGLSEKIIDEIKEIYKLHNEEWVE
jgi:hypothetical protein